MSDLKPRHYVTGVILFTLVMMAVVTLITRGREVKSDFIDSNEFDEMNTTFNRYEQTLNMTSDLESQLSSGLPQPLSAISVFFLKGYQVLAGLFTTLGFTEDIISGTAQVFGFAIPNWIPTLLIAMVTVMIVFSIISAILQRDI